MGEITSPLPFIGVTPCRIVDTRGNGAPIQGGLFAGGSDVRNYVLAGICGIPAAAQAVSLNFTVTGPGQTIPGFLVAWPTGGVVPLASTLNWDHVPAQVANAAIVPTNASVSISVNVSAPTHVILDINGYYGSPSGDPSNVFLGPFAGNSTMTGGGNTAIGDEALFNNTEGNGNTATGNDALATNNTGSFNTANGFAALLKNNGGSGNTAIGVSALFNNTIGFENIAVGHAAGLNLTTGDNNIDIGNPGVAGESDTIRIGTGGTQTQTFLAGVRGVTTGVNDAVGVMIDSAGQLGTVSSSRRFKRDIEDMGETSQALMKLRPVTFRYKADLDPTGSPQYGLVAEEVAEVFPDLAIYGKDGQPETVRYHVLVPMLLNEVQKDRKTIADLTARLERLEARMPESIP
jgi:Chaperone of endosialidase